jgi:hypothetical protein
MKLVEVTVSYKWFECLLSKRTEYIGSLKDIISLPIPETLDFNHVIKKQRAYDYWQEI